MTLLYYSSPAFLDCDFPLVRALAREGVDVKYLIHFAPYSKNTPLFRLDSLKPEYGIFNAREYPEFLNWGDYLDLDNVFVANDSVGKTSRIVSNLSLLAKLRKFSEKIRPDILHIVESPSYLQFPLSIGKKTIYTIHDPVPHTGEEKKADRILRSLSSGTAAGFILLNSLQDDDFSKKYGVSPSKIFHSKLGQYDCYRRFGTGCELPYKYFLFVGRISPYKGIEYAVRAFNSICDRFPDTHFVIAGSGNAYFKDEIAENDRIHLFNRYIPNDEMADLISGADFLVCPYTDATQSGVIHTSFAFGKPVVASATGEIPYVVEDGITGLLSAPRDTAGLEKNISALLSDEVLREDMELRIKSQQEGGSDSWAAIAREYISIYKKV